MSPPPIVSRGYDLLERKIMEEKLQKNSSSDMRSGSWLGLNQEDR